MDSDGQFNILDNETKVSKKHSQLWSIIAHQLASNWVLCGLLFALALCFNLYRLGNPSIWFDEAFSVGLAQQSFPLLWHIIFALEPNMELYYLFLHAWLVTTALFGLHPTEFVVRLPSAIFAASSTVALFLLGRRFLGLLPALIGAGLYLLNDLQLVYAQQARSFSLQLFLLCVAWYAFLAYVTGNLRPSVQSHHLTGATLRFWPPLDFAWSLAAKGTEANDLVLAKPRCYWRVDSPYAACQPARPSNRLAIYTTTQGYPSLVSHDQWQQQNVLAFACHLLPDHTGSSRTILPAGGQTSIHQCR